MAKQKTSKKRIASSVNTPTKLRKGMGVDTYDPMEVLLDEERIGLAIWECLKEGDSEGVVEIVEFHLEALASSSP